MSHELEELERKLREDIKSSLSKQGFCLEVKDNSTDEVNSKEKFRRLQSLAKQDILLKNSSFIKNNVHIIRKYSLSSDNFNPLAINLELKEVLPNSVEEIIYKWWNLVWWSIPYQRSYGRQMRFILWDTTHNAPFGLIGLQSPILKQAVRDKSLKIPSNELDYWVNRSMYAQRIGALPPYNELLGGKMVALSLIANEIKEKYKNKYSNKVTLLKNRELETDLLFITTTSAFGRSSIYNRLKMNNDLVAKKLGYTEGYGSFQISDDLYDRLIEYLDMLGMNTKRGFGAGPSRKLKLITLACKKLGLPNFSYHGIKREYYCFSLVENLNEVISKDQKPLWKKNSLKQLEDFWKQRWLEKRIITHQSWKEFNLKVFIDNVLTKLYTEEVK